MRKISSLLAALLFVTITASAQQPTVSSVSPLLGYPGTSVTIIGNNFNTAPANNIVYFGATRATVTSASTTELTAVVPLGATYVPVSVNNAALGLTGSAVSPFLQTFDNSGYIPGAVAFDPRFDINAPDYVHFTMADIDGDGKTDMVSLSSTSITIYRNNSSAGNVTDGSFATGVSFTIEPYMGQRCVMADDLDGDGKKDIAVLEGTRLEIFRNTSTPGAIDVGSLAPSISIDIYSSFSYNSWATTADMDGDGRTDIVTVYENSTGSSSFSVLLNLCNPGNITTATFALQTEITLPGYTAFITSGDIDGDYKPDLIFSSAPSGSTSNHINVIRNIATPGTISSESFEAPVEYSTGIGYINRRSILADLDGDGAQDIIVTNGVDGTLSILRNTNSGPGINSYSLQKR